ncbi:MAG: hypothetical protein M1824_005131 [Vezdaea acicularis]|nr:MAG: hypothetical protein M1824_005131 [Vezdaea acicularis]
MSEVTPTRRSGRKRQRTRYTLDAFEGHDMLMDSSASDEGARENESDDDDEFKPPADVEVMENDEDELLDDGEALADSNEDDGPGEDEDIDEAEKDGSMYGRRREDPLEGSRARDAMIPERDMRDVPVFETAAPGANLRMAMPSYRLVRDLGPSTGKYHRISTLFGTEFMDVAPIIRGRDKWANVPTFPTREADENGVGGLRYSFFNDDSSQLPLTDHTKWEWYSDAVDDTHGLEDVTEEIGRSYLPRQSHQKLPLLVGPSSNQTMCHLGAYESLYCGQAFESNHDADAEERPDISWIFNAGEKVQSMDWAPPLLGEVDQEDQYVAISTLPDDPVALDQNGVPLPNQQSAFKPSPPSRAAIQIWRISSTGQATSKACAKLHQVVCTDWGPIMKLKWCPVPRETGSRLLAIISADGYIRILALHPESSNRAPSTTYIKVHAPIFSARPPNTICTSLAWLSTSDIAAGHANGFVSVWDIASALTSPKDPPPTAEAAAATTASTPTAKTASTPPPPNPRPYFHQPLHQTYIHDLQSGYPSRPTLLISCSMDGYLRATLLPLSALDPVSSSVLSQRSRMAPSAIAWCDALQSVLALGEDLNIKAHPIRRFYSSVQVGKVGCAAGALAVGACSPILLVGGLDGKVLGLNPLRRMFGGKNAVGWGQVWFAHEWARGVSKAERGADGDTAEEAEVQRADEHDDTNPDSAEADKTERVPPTPTPPPGIVRILDGFKLLPTPSPPTKNGVLLATIYEDRTAVRALAWNPDIKYGGWAAAGMGSGLVRVQDLAL